MIMLLQWLFIFLLVYQCVSRHEHRYLHDLNEGRHFPDNVLENSVPEYDDYADDNDEISEEKVALMNVLKKEFFDEIASRHYKNSKHSNRKSHKDSPVNRHLIKIQDAKTIQSTEGPHDFDDNIIKILKVEKKRDSGDNVGIATVTVDDTVEQADKLVREINPDDLFLESSVNGTNSTSRPGIILPHVSNKKLHKRIDDTTFITILAGCFVAGIAGIGLAGYCWFKLRQGNNNEKGKNASVFNEAKPETLKKGTCNPSDEKLVENAEMFHYFHAKKQMQQLNVNQKNGKDAQAHLSEDDEDEDTVYECAGLARPGDMKVLNPLFSDAESHHSAKLSDSPNDSPRDGYTDMRPPLD